MRAPPVRPCLPLLGLLGLAGVAAVGGCQSGAERAKKGLVPVTGEVVTGGAVPAGALVTFHPDESKGNTARALPMGKVRPDGRYELVTGADAGAPPGWYRVTLTTFAAPGGGGPRIDPRYAQLDRTPLAVEVVAEPGPGQYNLRLAK